MSEGDPMTESGVPITASEVQLDWSDAPDGLAEASWIPAVLAAVRRSPDPERAARLAVRVLSETAKKFGEELQPAASGAPEVLGKIIYALCGVAPFFATFLQRYPEWLLELLGEHYTRVSSAEVLAERFERFALRTADMDPAVRLRVFKYRELARISVRECCEQWLPLERSGETLTELTHLADFLLDRSLGIAEDRVRERFGPPQWKTEDGRMVEPGFCVLGLGKLGSRELNYSSDVDLIFLRESAEGQALEEDSDKLTPDRYFARLAQDLSLIVSASTSEGFLYRVDLELRPEGSHGPIVISDRALITYYETSADAWEKAAFMKARPVAGDQQLGWRTIQALIPVIYRSTMDFSSVSAIRQLKERVAREHGQSERGFNVKIDAGGIRDIEFVAQAMQLLHAGRIPQLRRRGTQRALRELSAAGLFSSEKMQGLLDAYLFLRRLENRLQMEAECQTHLLPIEPKARMRIVRAMGFTGPEAMREFEGCLDAHQQRISEFFASFLFDSGKDRILPLFERQVPRLLMQPGMRAMIEHLAESFAQQIDSSYDPERALNNLDRFIEGVGPRRYFYELLLDRPELVLRLVTVFATSRFLSSYFASFPRLIEPVFANPDVLLLSREELYQDLKEIKETVFSQEGDDVELELEALRLFHHREILNIGVLEIGEKVERKEAERSLTEVAEICIEEALAFERRRAGGLVAVDSGGHFLVVAMGKLASREMSHGSDLDLIFLYDSACTDSSDLAQAQHEYVRLSQRLISLLQMHTSEGVCYEVDTRLRPSGNQGTLVTSIAAFERYHEARTEVWERQALLRARAVAGDSGLEHAFSQIRRKLLLRELHEDPAQEIFGIRARMERELAHETVSRRDFKTGRGGILDVESLIQYLCLLHCREHAELLEVGRVDELIARLRHLGLLESESARVLSEGWDFLQRLSNRLRIVENRSISDLDSERGDLDGIARLLGYVGTGRESGPRRRLLLDYRRHTEAIRRVYLDTLGIREDGG